MKTRVRKKSTSVAAAAMENDHVIESSDHIVVKRKKGKDKQLVKQSSITSGNADKLDGNKLR